MNLEDLMRLSYNAGREDALGVAKFWEGWWSRFGEDRHDAFLDEQEAVNADSSQDALEEGTGKGSE